MAMGGASSERFYAAATYVGLDGSPSSSSTGVSSKFSNDVALLLYALYQQATVGPCNVSKPRGWSPAEQSKWTSWHGLGNMASAEAMRLFVKILEEEDPGWYSRASNSIQDPVDDVEMNHMPTVKPVVENGHSTPEEKFISTETKSIDETQDKDVVSEGSSSVAVYDQWVAAPINGKPPKARYEHGAAVIRDKMYVFAGNHNGRYLSDLHVLDMSSWTWSKINAKYTSDSSNSSDSLAPCAGHSLISWGHKILSVAGHTKYPSETIHVKVFNPQTESWSTLKTYGKAPSSRGGQSVTLVRSSLVIFGGQDAKRSMLNDLHILDLETMTWDEFDAQGVPPPPRSDHAAAVHAERYVLIFGGSSHATCFNDLHVLDLQTMEWSRPKQKGYIPTPRAGHGGVTIGENWFIVGGGDNKSGVSETVVLNMSTLVWSVVSTAGRASIASEGLSLVVSSYSGEDVLVSFGGYNGHYNNEVNILKPSHKSDLQSKIIETPVNESASALPSATHATQDMESELHSLQDGIREMALDMVDLDSKKLKGYKGGDLLATIKGEKEELELSLKNERLLSAQLKQELSDAKKRNTEQHKDLQAIRGQLATEQSRCFKLEVDVAELRQKLQSMEALRKELELLKRQKAAASEEAALLAKQRQSSGGVWSWIAGTPKNQNSDF